VSIDERRRLDLAHAVQRVLGDEAGITLMEMLPPVGWADVATRYDVDAHRAATADDLRGLRREMNTEFATFRREVSSEFAAVRQEMSSEFAAVRQEMSSEFAAVRQEMSSEFAAVRQDMSSGLTAVRQDMSSGLTAVRQEMRELELKLDARFERGFRHVMVTTSTLMVTGFVATVVASLFQ